VGLDCRSRVRNHRGNSARRASEASILRARSGKIRLCRYMAAAIYRRGIALHSQLRGHWFDPSPPPPSQGRHANELFGELRWRGGLDAIPVHATGPPYAVSWSPAHAPLICAMCPLATKGATPSSLEPATPAQEHRAAGNVDHGARRSRRGSIAGSGGSRAPSRCLPRCASWIPTASG